MFDGLGSERTVTNSSQTVTGTITHDAFGLTVATTGSSTNPYKFAATSGYRDDGDCGLTHVGARYYDSQVGRFITRDTELDQHPYLYCEHDPVNYFDGSGHQPTIAGAGPIVRKVAGGLANIIVGGIITIAIGLALIGVGWAFIPAFVVGGIIGGAIGGGLGAWIGGNNVPVGMGVGAVVGGVVGPIRGGVYAVFALAKAVRALSAIE